MTKIAKNFYLNGLIGLLLVFFVCYFAFGAVFPAFSASMAAKIEAAAAEEFAALTGGQSSELLTDITLVNGVKQVLSLSEGGYVVDASAEGAEGEIVLSIALDASGAVSGIVVAEAEEAPDYGGKALQEDYLSTYFGRTDSEVEAFTGATYTSAAIKACVDEALLQYEVINGVEYEAPVELTDEEKLAAALSERLGEGYEKLDCPELADSVVEVYSSEKGCGIVAEADGVGGKIRLMIYMNEKGKVKKIVPIFHSEPVGRGDQFLTEASLYSYEDYSSYGYFDDGSGVCVFTKLDNTNLAIAKMLMGATAQWALLNPPVE